MRVRRDHNAMAPHVRRPIGVHRATHHRRHGRPRQAQEDRRGVDVRIVPRRGDALLRVLRRREFPRQGRPRRRRRVLRGGDRRRPGARRGQLRHVVPLGPRLGVPTARRVRRIPATVRFRRSIAALASQPRRAMHVSSQVRRLGEAQDEAHRCAAEPPHRRERRVLPARVPRRHRRAPGRYRFGQG